MIIQDNMNCIVFSRDRSSQLDLLIRSIKKYFQNWRLSNFIFLYKYTNPEFMAGYNLLKQEHPEFVYINESSFYNDVIYILDSCESDKLMFLVDDIIFKEPFNPDDVDLSDSEVICHSLRLCPRIDYCYSLNIPMRIPKMDGLKWRWREQGYNDWGYPMSLDGHVFRTNDIVRWIKLLKFNSPNEQESRMDEWARSDFNLPPKMSCFEESKIVNIVSNRVNVDHPNRQPDKPTDVAELNRLFLAGKRIKLPDIKNNMSVHIEYLLEIL